MSATSDPVPPPEVATDIRELDVDDDPGEDGDDTNAARQVPLGWLSPETLNAIVQDMKP